MGKRFWETGIEVKIRILVFDDKTSTCPNIQLSRLLSQYFESMQNYFSPVQLDEIYQYSPNISE